MANINIFSGRLTRDPEIKTIQREGEASSVAHFSIACKNDYKDKDGNYGATFVDLTAFGGKVKPVESLSKGRMVYVECHMVNNNYTDKDGKKVYSNDFIVDKIEFLDSKPQENVPQAQPNQYQQIPQSGYGYGGYPQPNYGQMPPQGMAPQGQMPPLGQIPPQGMAPQGMAPQGQMPPQGMAPTLDQQFGMAQGQPDPNAIFNNGVGGSQFH